MLRAVPRRHYRAGLAVRRQDINQGPELHSPPGGVKQAPDVDIGSLPKPVLVGVVPIGNDACRLKFGERIVHMGAGVGEHGAGTPE